MMQNLLPQDFNQWKRELRHVCGEFDARRSTADHHFYGAAERVQFGDLEIARIQSNAASIARTRPTSRSDDRFCFLVLQARGHQHLAVGRLEPAEVKAGDLMLLDASSPFEMLPHGVVENLSVHLPRSLVRSQLGGRAFSGKLSGDEFSVKALAGLIGQVAAAGSAYGASVRTSDALRQAMLALLVPASGGGAAVPDAGLYLAALAHIDKNLASFDLTPEWLADRLNVSRRQLYRVFAAEGSGGIAQVILDRRLDRAAALLRRADRGSLAVGVVAIEAGLADPAHFSRTFRRRFGMTPRQFRETAGA